MDVLKTFLREAGLERRPFGDSSYGSFKEVPKSPEIWKNVGKYVGRF
jgi:hypothetical protein